MGSSSNTNIANSTVDDLTKAGVKELRINSEVANISLDLKTLKTIQDEIKTDVNFSAKKVDNNTLSQQAKGAVEQMQMAGIFSGKENNKFDPKGTATRAEVSAVINRFVEIVENK